VPCQLCRVRLEMIDLAVAMILGWVSFEDLRRYRIPNVAILVLVSGFVVGCLWEERIGLLIAHAVFALVALSLMFGAFVARIIGGGDAKLITAALLWIGPENALTFATLLLCAVLVYAGGAQLGWLPARRSGVRMRIPFGPCIAAAWLAVLTLRRIIL
jgi:Flp pilus assembly protein protease CpaA